MPPKKQPPEDSESVWRGLTITFQTNYERKPYIYQFSDTKEILYKIMPKYFRLFKFIPEFTESGRIHYHGKFKQEDKALRLKGFEELRRRCGFIKVETSNLSSKWDDYIIKDVKTTCKLIGINNIIVSNEDFATEQAEKTKEHLKTIRAFEKGVFQDAIEI